jgi:hypothetical protein
MIAVASQVDDVGGAAPSSRRKPVPDRDHHIDVIDQERRCRHMGNRVRLLMVEMVYRLRRCEEAIV